MRSAEEWEKKADRIFDAAGKREPLLAWLVSRWLTDSGLSPNSRAGLKAFLSALNQGRRKVKQIVKWN